jgi:hypothetical protein
MLDGLVERQDLIGFEVRRPVLIREDRAFPACPRLAADRRRASSTSTWRIAWGAIARKCARFSAGMAEEPASFMYAS